MTIAELEGIDPKYFKRTSEDKSKDRPHTVGKSGFFKPKSHENTVDKTFTRLKASRESPPRTDSQGSKSKQKGFMEDSIKKVPKILLEQEELKKERSKRKMDVEVPVGGSVSLTKTPLASGNVSRMSTSRRDKSHEIHHIEPVLDRLDLCDCPNHSRRSLSSCRMSKRKSQPLQDVAEKAEEEDSQSSGVKLAPRLKPKCDH